MNLINSKFHNLIEYNAYDYGYLWLSQPITDMSVDYFIDRSIRKLPIHIREGWYLYSSHWHLKRQLKKDHL